MKKVFVIIVTYKGKRWYDKCFTSLRNSSIPVQTVVVDNTPEEEDAEYIKSHYPEIHLIRTNENLGFGRANNLGMRYALDNGCDYVFLLNQDAWIEPDTIEKMINVGDLHPEYGIISPMHLEASKQHLNFILKDGHDNYELLSDLYFGCVKDSYTITYSNAAAWMLPHKTLETIGGFCPLIYHYGEDDDYMNRVRFHGLKMGLVPAARIVHDTEIRLENRNELLRRSNIENTERYLDITCPRSVGSWKRYLLRKWIWKKLRHEDWKYYKSQYLYLKSKQKDIETCREAHKIKQANWL